MIWIELLGPSGVGKSYWCHKFIQKYPEYEPKQMVLKRIAQSTDLEKASWKIKLMFWIYKLNIYKISSHFKHKLFHYFFKTFQRRSKTLFTGENQELIIQKYLEATIKLGQPAITILKNINYFHDVFLLTSFYQYYLQDSDVYLAEDGLLHLCPVTLPQEVSAYCLIFTKDENKIKHQRLQRATTKPTTFIEFLLPSEKLKEYIDKYIERYHTKTEDYIQNIPDRCCVVNADNDDVLQKMHQFIQSCRSQ